MRAEFTRLAIIRQAHGVRGEVKIESFTSPPDALFSYSLSTADGKPVHLKKTGTLRDWFICRVQGVDSRNQAEALKGTILGTETTLLRPEDAGEWASTLEGIEVKSSDGGIIGTVAKVVNYGAGDILVITCPHGEELMLPYAHQFFPKPVHQGSLLCILPDTMSSEADASA